MIDKWGMRWTERSGLGVGGAGEAVRSKWVFLSQQQTGRRRILLSYIDRERGRGKGLDHLYFVLFGGGAVSGGGFPERVGALSQQIATSIIIHLTRVSRHRLSSIWTPPAPCSSSTDRVSP